MVSLGGVGHCEPCGGFFGLTSTIKIKMMAEQIITKELMFQNEQDEKLENRIVL